MLKCSWWCLVLRLVKRSVHDTEIVSGVNPTDSSLVLVFDVFWGGWVVIVL